MLPYLAARNVSFCTRQFDVSADVDFRFRRAGERVRAGELLELSARLADDAKHLPSSDTLKMRPGNVVSPTNITWFGPGVMQIELGAPISGSAGRRSACCRSPAFVPGTGGTSIVNIRRNLPSVSNT